MFLLLSAVAYLHSEAKKQNKKRCKQVLELKHFSPSSVNCLQNLQNIDRISIGEDVHDC